MKKVFAMLMVLVLVLGGTAMAETQLTYDGTVVAGKTEPITVPFGGKIGTLSVRKGDPVKEGDVLATISTTLEYAPVEGTVAGLYAQEGDSTGSITERYNAVLFIEPTRKYTIEANSEKAYNSSENYFLHRGERVYMACTADGTHTGTGIITDVTDNGYNIEVTGGEFVLDEKVAIYRAENRAKESRLGSGKVKRATAVAVKGGESSSILKLHVKNGDFVERGEVLFETVDGVLDGYYAPDNKIKSPVTGIVSEAEKNPGEAVGKGDILMKVVPSDSFQVEFEVPEEELFCLSEGQSVTMELRWDNTADKTYSGKIISISHKSEDAKEGSDKNVYKAYASFEPDERIRLGMTMYIYINEQDEPEADEPAAAEPAEEEPAAEPAEEPEK